MARVLLTGATSFTGVWIARALADAGHEVIAPLKRVESDYEGLRRDRMDRLKSVARVAFDAPFGSPAFLDLLKTARPDVFAHHAADIPGYRNADYDVAAGVTRNLTGAGVVFEAAATAGVHGVIATGTGFEDAAEGGLAVSPYGLSKKLTNDGFRHLALWRGLAFGRFMINGPFGPLEEGGWSGRCSRPGSRARPAWCGPQPMCATTSPCCCWAAPMPGWWPRCWLIPSWTGSVVRRAMSARRASSPRGWRGRPRPAWGATARWTVWNRRPSQSRGWWPMTSRPSTPHGTRPASGTPMSTTTARWSGAAYWAGPPKPSL
uniref:NAD(P)-dependent oxidoreductase n=1 Tax=Phenylobacterium glaciei TaxID=2803784 RepID=A0A974P3Q6_9CAUL|nr:NAD(P)-dependent oxidoreductase [Phenylobacterium glaciei]